MYLEQGVYLRVFTVIILLFITVYAQDSSIEKVCSNLGLVPASKAIVQWERVFSSERRMQKYRIDGLPPHERDKLKIYLLQHAADSNQPMVPGL